MGDGRHGLDVTIVSEYFYPDTAGSGTRLTELAIGLVERGVDVSVLTSQPSYSSLDRGRSERPGRETYEGVHVRRLPATRFDKDSLWGRTLNNLTFFVSSMLSLVAGPRSDVVLLTTLPPFLPLLGIPLSYLPGCRYVIFVHDIYPEMAAELGYLSRAGLPYRVWAWLNVRAYSRAAGVAVLGDTMKATVEDRYGVTDATVIHNWEDGDRIRPIPKRDNEFSREHDLVDRFTVLYSGNIGRFHDLKSTIEAMRIVEARREDAKEGLVALFIGEGGVKDDLRQTVERFGLTTVEFLPYQPHDLLSYSLTCGDVSLVSVNADVTGLCVSGKFYTALASGQAVLAVADPASEIGRTVEETGCGIRVDPGSPEEVADAIEYWLDNPDVCTEMGTTARALFEDRYTMEGAIDAHYRWLASVVSASG